MNTESNFVEFQNAKRIWAVGSVHSNYESFKSIKEPSAPEIYPSNNTPFPFNVDVAVVVDVDVYVAVAGVIDVAGEINQGDEVHIKVFDAERMKNFLAE